jgi:hypothetical protein
MRLFILVFSFFTSLLCTSPSLAQGTSLTPDAISAKAILEDILTRRYKQDLSTRINQDLFTMSANLDITKIVKKDEEQQVEPLSDLMLGIIDPDDLRKKITDKNKSADFNSLLSQYGIKKVKITVGLKPELPEDKQKAVNEWLTQRLKDEFGQYGDGQVTRIENIAQEEESFNDKSRLEQIKEFQDLAGKIVLAVALILCALLWGVLARAPRKETIVKNENTSTASPMKENKEELRRISLEKAKVEKDENLREINEIAARIKELLPQISNNFEGLIRNWSQSGELGKFKIVCFAEAVSKDIGKLPIPVDIIEDVKRIFSQMSNVELSEKKDALEKVYWDVVTVVNLGTEALSEPFAYLGQSSLDTINSVLLEKNTKMQTLVALYMPDDLRADYIGNLDVEKKKEILKSAADLQSISAKEFKSIDEQLAFQLQKRSGDDESEIRLDLTLNKIISSFSIREQLSLLKELPPQSLNAYKTTYPSLAFLDEWPNKDLEKLMKQANTDELSNYLRLVEQMSDKVLSCCPPLTAEMVRDELKRPNELSDNEIERLLVNLQKKMERLHEQKSIELHKIFSTKDSDTNVPKVA